MNTIYRSAADVASTRRTTPEQQMRLALANGNKRGLTFGLVGRGVLLGWCLVLFAMGERPYGWAFLDAVMIVLYAWELRNTRRVELGFPPLRLFPEGTTRQRVIAGSDESTFAKDVRKGGRELHDIAVIFGVGLVAVALSIVLGGVSHK